MSTSHASATSADETHALRAPAEAGARPGMRRALVLVLAAIVLGLGGLYLVRAALVDVGGFTLGSSTALDHLVELGGKWRFWAGGGLLAIVLLISLELYGSQELSKVVPLYSLSYVLIALIGQLFLHERVTLDRWAGIAIIVTGVVVLLRS
jgi:drug/metabolite transporter (DMT)-like permease